MTPDTLTDSKILNDLSRAIELTKLGKPFFWQMNFEIAWGARYAYWQREYGDKPDRDMYAIDLTIIEGSLKEHGYLQRSDSNGVAISDGNLFLRDCRLAQVVTSTLAKKLADIVLLEAFGLVKVLGLIAPTSMTRQAGTGSGTQTLTRKMTTTNLGTPITITEDDEEKTRLAVIEHTSPQLRNKKFATLHVRRGDMLGWCDTDSEALRRFISCALSRSEDDEVNAGNVPILWFTDDDDETYQIEVTTALTEELTLYRSNFTGNLTGASEVLVIFGDALVNKVIEENLKAVARDGSSKTGPARLRTRRGRCTTRTKIVARARMMVTIRIRIFLMGAARWTGGIRVRRTGLFLRWLAARMYQQRMTTCWTLVIIDF